MLGGGVSHPSQLTTGLVIKSVTTSPTLAGERMLFILQVSILSEQIMMSLTAWSIDWDKKNIPKVQNDSLGYSRYQNSPTFHLQAYFQQKKQFFKRNFTVFTTEKTFFCQQI